MLGRLLCSDDRSVDEVVVGGLLAVLGLMALSAYDLIVLRHDFSPVAFGGGAAAIISAVGGIIGLRNKLAPGAPGGG